MIGEKSRNQKLPVRRAAIWRCSQGGEESAVTASPPRATSPSVHSVERAVKLESGFACILFSSKSLLTIHKHAPERLTLTFRLEDLS